MHPYVYAIDIGNTSIRGGLVDTDKCLLIFRDQFLQGENLEQMIIDSIERGRSQVASNEAVPIVVCSVRPSVSMPIVNLLTQRYSLEQVSVVRYSDKLQVRISYTHPERLGADRITHCIFGARVYAGQNLVIIGAGTAITVDAFSKDGVFEGGCIIPGPALQLTALNRDTEQLPLITCGYKPALLSLSTEEGMVSGVLNCLGGGITAMVKALTEHFCGQCTVLTCGGSWPLIENLVGFTFLHKPEMTLVGTALYYKIFYNNS